MASSIFCLSLLFLTQSLFYDKALEARSLGTQLAKSRQHFPCWVLSMWTGFPGIIRLQQTKQKESQLFWKHFSIGNDQSRPLALRSMVGREANTVMLCGLAGGFGWWCHHCTELRRRNRISPRTLVLTVSSNGQEDSRKWENSYRLFSHSKVLSFIEDLYDML